MEIKQAVEELNLYRKNLKRMQYIKSKIAELQSRLSSLGGGGINLGIQGGQVSCDDKIISVMDSIRNLQKELLDEEVYGLCVQNDIEQKIYNLKEPYCSVLRGYYVENKNLERLAVDMNYTFDGIKSIKFRGVRMYAKLPEIHRELQII